LAKNLFFYYLYGYSEFCQIHIHSNDQEKTTFTYLYGTYAYRGMLVEFCNAPTTFQRCMMAILSDFIKYIMEVFRDDFLLYGTTDDHCLDNLSKVLQRCEDVNLVLNWEKCHFIVQEWVVLGHIVSNKDIEVDKAKVEVIEKSPPPTSVKGVRSFLRHVSFYQRFIKDFQKFQNLSPNCLTRMCPLSLIKNA